MSVPNFHNIGNYMVSVVTDLFMGNIVTLGTHNDKLDELLDTNQTLTTAWTTGPAGADLLTKIEALAPKDPNHPTQDEAIAFNGFVATLSQSGSFPVSEFSQGVGTTLMTMLSTYYTLIDGKNAGQGSVDSSAINSFNGIVSATGNNEEQIGQNLGKTEGSVVQTDAGAQQTFSGIVDAVEGFVSIVASLLQQLYS